MTAKGYSLPLSLCASSLPPSHEKKSKEKKKTCQFDDTNTYQGEDKKKKKINQIGLTRHDSVGWATTVTAHVHTCPKGVVHRSVSHYLWTNNSLLLDNPQWRTGNKASIYRPRRSGDGLACDLDKSCGNGRHLWFWESGVEWGGKWGEMISGGVS